MICAIIDVGSNSMRLSVYECGEEKEIKNIFSKKATVGLVKYVKKGMLQMNGIVKTSMTLLEFREDLESFDVDIVSVFATAALRNVRNSKQAITQIKEVTGFDVEILSGEEEARLSFVGATNSVEMEDGILVDIGGGSTEVVIFENKQIKKACSIPYGSLNTYIEYVEEFIPTKTECGKIGKVIKDELKGIFGDLCVADSNICGVGGSIRAIVKLKNVSLGLDKSYTDITFDQMNSLVKAIVKDRKNSLELILDVKPDRARTLTTGLVILRAIAKFFDSQQVLVSNYGVREGFLYGKILDEREASEHEQ